jgi:hypothetical protein
MATVLLILAATLSASPDPKLVKQAEHYAEQLAKRKLPDGKTVRVELKVPRERQTYFGKVIPPPPDPITFLIWLPPSSLESSAVVEAQSQERQSAGRLRQMGYRVYVQRA